jgi:hypothetical protein
MILTIDGIVKAARSGFVTTVGLGALAYQQAQVQRQALNRQLPRLLHELGEAVDDRLATLSERLCDGDGIEQRLPAPLRSAVHQVHSVARDVRAQVPNLLDTNGSNHHEVADTA